MSASSSSAVCRVAALQVTCGNDKAANWRLCSQLVEQAAASGARIVFLPEACDYVAADAAESRRLAEPLDGATVGGYRRLAARLGVWLSLGGCHELATGAGSAGAAGRVYNTHVLVDSCGQLAGVYRKAHLFDAVGMRESAYVAPGAALPPLVATPAGCVAPLICYDLRFAEMAVTARAGGAQLLAYPSVFTPATGQAHWLPLLRARAIETQCYVVAAAQAGHHAGTTRHSHGHSLVVDPWGRVVAEAPAAAAPPAPADAPATVTQPEQQLQQLLLADIDLQLVERVRRDMPVMQQRRHDLYPELQPLPRPVASTATADSVYPFGGKQIGGDMVFLESGASYAFVNRRCVVPGHVLVATRQAAAARLHQLSPGQLADLFATVQLVARLVARVWSTATASTVCVQDGAAAGQTVPQVHVHVMPRSPGDLAFNDHIYQRLQQHDSDDTATSGGDTSGGVPQPHEQWRHPDEMRRECAQLRQALSHLSQDASQ